MIEQALRLARRGLPVFPCWSEDKRPATRHGFRDATTVRDAIRSWHWEDRLIGVPTGSASGIAVLDIDPRHGGDEWLKGNVRRLPLARSHATRSGGVHLLFATDGSVRNSAGMIAPGVDVRGEGGYVIWWPASGCLIVDHVPIDRLPPWPEWLRPCSRGSSIRTESSVRPCRGLSHYGEAALDGACRRILDAPPGTQEVTINSEAYSIGRLAGAGAIPAGFALQALRWAAQRIATYDSARPWRGDELARKVERAFDQGLANPRRVRR